VVLLELVVVLMAVLVVLELLLLLLILGKTMNKYAIVKDGTVVNIIEYESQPSNPPPGFEDGHVAIQADQVSPGWQYADGKFFDPNPPEPIEILPSVSLTDLILSNPEELAKLKAALEAK
jgi:hypothetical protein